MAELHASTFEQRASEAAIRRAEDQKVREEKIEANARNGVMPNGKCQIVFDALNEMLYGITQGTQARDRWHSLAPGRMWSRDCQRALVANLQHRGYNPYVDWHYNPHGLSGVIGTSPYGVEVNVQFHQPDGE